MISLAYNYSYHYGQFIYIIVSDVSEVITKTIRINFAKQYVLYNIEER